MKEVISKMRLAFEPTVQNSAKNWIGLALVSLSLAAPLVAQDKAESFSESKYLSNIRQLTLEGAKSGEGYFSKDGKAMVFQSEREPGNPFYQIYYMDRETGDVERVSPGYGKTTCAWIHPDGNRVLFASTQYDPEATDKQKAELEMRASGKERRYAWDYDSTYELIEWNRDTKSYRKLTDVAGYDAEASYSPDGQWIAFASNRRAYTEKLSDKEQEMFKLDPASACDLYLMKSDGSMVKRLTDEWGYDGGPFFSPNGKRICWRRFSHDGATAEIYTMNVDGSDVQRLTNVGAMSWAPYYHPSGDYLIYASNPLGFANFELYIVSASGGKPQRVTGTEGFDGLPVFTPDGKELVWTSNRTANKKSQLFIATWDDKAARQALGIDSTDSQQSKEVAAQVAAETQVEYRATDIGKHIDYLCRPELGGRLTGTEGEKKATAYVASFMESLGLEPAGASGTWYHEFPFTAGVSLGPKNQLTDGTTKFELDRDWRPVAFSKNGDVPSAEIVFAGYGIVAPKENNQPDYDSYVHLDVEGKWVMVLRQLPTDISAERRQHLARYSNLRYKAMAARDRGAVGLIVVSGPQSGVRSQLVPLQLDGALSGSGLAVVSVSDQLALSWFAQSEEKLDDLQKTLDKGEMMMGFKLPKVKVEASIDVSQVRKSGRNVLGILRAGDKPTKHMMIVGAHIDHLGSGENGSSLAKEEEKGGTHRGADDNASGVAGMLEIAQNLAGLKKAGKLNLKQDVLFAAWSGEELGLIGSSYFADSFHQLYPDRMPAEHGAAANASASKETENPHAGVPQKSAKSLYPVVGSALNLDMIGRLRENLVLQGIGSSSYWTSEIEKRNAVVGLPLVLQADSYLPTDASTFYIKGVPILSAFTGSHSEYHTPRDTPDLINYEGAAKVAQLMGLVARSLATSETIPEYVSQKAPENQGQKAMLTAYLGTVPDYAQADIKGVLLSGVSASGPAAAAGVKGGDVIVELAGKKIENIYDYTYAIESLKVGQETEIAVRRGEQVLRMKVTPTSRQ
ncbi:MAG: M28 family peptidase [Pirellulales bacterium]